MSIVAVSRVINEAMKQAQPMPGHVFSLYLPFWREGEWRKDGDEAKRRALSRVKQASSQQHVKRLANELRTRQRQLAKASGALTIEATSTSPFVTGMGEEHAVENGFAFLSPYGLPYLAGSGVKGVIRRAAEELAAGLNPDGNGGWTFTRVMWLFGYEENVGYIPQLDAELHADGETGVEANRLLNRLDKDRSLFTELGSDKTHFMGVLSFWDVIIADDLDIDILTPHYGEYYQGNEPPHDAGQPQPNPFLVVAPGARFTFHIACAEHRLPPSLRGDTWRDLVQAAFDHAFTWGGFGAKTAVGYGVLQRADATSTVATTSPPSSNTSQQAAPATQPPAASGTSVSPYRPGQRVIDTASGETGTIVAVRGDVVVVDFDGMEDEVPPQQLKAE